MECKLGDFGLAMKLEKKERRGSFCGTPTYMAPEIIKKTGHAYEADVWSLGVLIYVLL
jgi:serine/threonine protein kinase